MGLGLNSGCRLNGMGSKLWVSSGWDLGSKLWVSSGWVGSNFWVSSRKNGVQTLGVVWMGVCLILGVV